MQTPLCDRQAARCRSGVHGPQELAQNEDDAIKETIDGFDRNEMTLILPKRLTDATEDGGWFGIRFG